MIFSRYNDVFMRASFAQATFKSSCKAFPETRCCVDMDVTLFDIKAVGIAGFEHDLRISRKQDVIECADGIFVKLNPRSTSLIAVVLENNPLAPSPLPKNFSLTSSVGLCTLLKMRNDTPADSPLKEKECSLFDGEALAKQPRRSRGDTKIMRQTHVPITIHVEIDGIEHDIITLRQVLDKDLLFVKYDEESMGAALKIIRDSGFKEPRQDLAVKEKRIYARSNGKYVVKFSKDDGTVGYKTCNSYEEAKLFKADVDAMPEGASHSSPEKVREVDHGAPAGEANESL